MEDNGPTAWLRMLRGAGAAAPAPAPATVMVQTVTSPAPVPVVVPAPAPVPSPAPAASGMLASITGALAQLATPAPTAAPTTATAPAAASTAGGIFGAIMDRVATAAPVGPPPAPYMVQSTGGPELVPLQLSEPAALQRTPKVLADEIRTTWPGEWSASGVDRAAELAEALWRKGIEQLPVVGIEPTTYTAPVFKVDDNGRGWRMGQVQGQRVTLDGRPFGYLGDFGEGGFEGNEFPQAIRSNGLVAWSSKGHGNVGFKVRTAPNGTSYIGAEWATSSDMETIRDVASIGAILTGAALMQPAAVATAAPAAEGGIATLGTIPPSTAAPLAPLSTAGLEPLAAASVPAMPAGVGAAAAGSGGFGAWAANLGTYAANAAVTVGVTRALAPPAPPDPAPAPAPDAGASAPGAAGLLGALTGGGSIAPALGLAAGLAFAFLL